jgi:hypothetical protein
MLHLQSCRARLLRPLLWLLPLLRLRRPARRLGRLHLLLAAAAAAGLVLAAAAAAAAAGG